MEFMHLNEFFNGLAALFIVATASSKTMVPLRVMSIVANCCLIASYAATHTYILLVLQAITLPLNAFRLYQMMALIKNVRASVRGNTSMDWLKPFMNRRKVDAGEILFRKGDEANHMYFVVDGQLHLNEIDINIQPGAVVGELGMLAPARTRTQTLVCTQSGSVLEIAYDRIEQLYYQNPKFGFYFLRLSTARLFENIARLERALVDRDQKILALRAAGAAR